MSPYPHSLPASFPTREVASGVAWSSWDSKSAEAAPGAVAKPQPGAALTQPTWPCWWQAPRALFP